MLSVLLIVAGFGFQDGDCSVAHVGAGRLPRCTDASGGILIGGFKGIRFCGVDAVALLIHWGSLGRDNQ